MNGGKGYGLVLVKETIRVPSLVSQTPQEINMMTYLLGW